MINRLMSATCVVLLLLGGCSVRKPAATDQPVSQKPTLVLLHANLIDGTGGEPVPDAAVLLAGEKILAIGPVDSFTLPAGVTTLDLTGMTILPGFINAHVHGGFVKTNLKAWAEGGVTTVRDEGARPGQFEGLKAFQAEINADLHYASLVSAGNMMAVPGGYGDLYVNSPEEARQAVLNEIEGGANAIKVALEDGYAGTTGLPKLTPAELKAIVTAAHEKGLPVSGHITQAAYVQPMLDAGVDDVAHLAYDSVSPETMQQMVDQGVYWVPTFTVFKNYGAPTAALQDNLRQFIKLGGKVALGNDYGGGPGSFELGIPMVEIENMSQSGMTPMQVIVSATLNAARVLRVEAQTGSLEAGKQADILVVAGNPLEDLQSLTRIQLVVHKGVIILDNMGD